MKRNATKKQVKTNDEGRIRWQWILLTGIGVVLLCGIGFFVYQGKKQWGPSGISDYFAQIKTWIAERKSRLHQDVTKVKQVVANKSHAEPQIHFEFYNTLPNMQVVVSESELTSSAKNDHPVSSPEKTTARTLASTQMTKKMPLEKPSSASISIVNADELEQEFAKQIKRITYVIQVGVFKNAADAERYKRSLAEAGFAANMVKLIVGQNQVYHVQLGPYSNKSQTKAIQQQLQKKGFSGLIRKT